MMMVRANVGDVVADIQYVFEMHVPLGAPGWMIQVMNDESSQRVTLKLALIRLADLKTTESI
jgi:hypothetical protein